MATKPNLDSKAPPSSPNLPGSPVLPTVASLPITGALNAGNLRGPEVSSNVTMQSFLRQQTQSTAPASSLSSRATTSVADDLNAFLSDSLKDLIPPGSASSTVQVTSAAVPKQVEPAAVSSFASVHPEYALQELEQNLFGLLCLSLAQYAPADVAGPASQEKEYLGKYLNRTIGMINSIFKSLLKESASLKTWIEKESQTPLYRSFCPFATSHFLSMHLEKANLPHIHPVLLKEWNTNYEECLILLKRHGLDAYNETEFPFSEQNKREVSMLTQLNQMVASGGSEGGMDAIMQMQLPVLIAFYEDLNEQLQRSPNDKIAIESWLKTGASQQDYPVPFFFSKEMLKRFKLNENSLEKSAPLFRELKDLYESCCRRLTALGLQEYLREAPPPALIAQFKQSAISQKDEYQKGLSASLSILRPLCTELKKLTVGAEANRRTIEAWLNLCKAQKNYPYPFMCGQEVYDFRAALVEVVNADELQELTAIYPFCCDQLRALGLDEYLNEAPKLDRAQMEKLAAAAVAPLKKALPDEERFKKELVFFREMNKQDDKTVDQWLKEHSPKSDYPLIWANKRMSQLKQFRDIKMELRRDWIACAEACIERVKNSVLRYHLEQIPQDASPELLAYLKT